MSCVRGAVRDIAPAAQSIHRWNVFVRLPAEGYGLRVITA